MHFHLYSLLRMAHLLSMAVWLANGLTVTSDMRRTIPLGKPHTELLIARIHRSSRITIGSGLLTIVTGLGLVFAQGGFSAMPLRIHVGLALTLVTCGVGATLAEPSWQRIVKAIRADDDVAEVTRLARRFSAFYGVEHALKLVVAALMIFKL